MRYSAHNRIWLLLILSFLISSCGVVERSAQPIEQSSVSETSKNTVVDQLIEAHLEWEGTPYILGGSGVGGIDCSAFTQVVFQDYFGLQLPRNTRQQLQEGQSVRRNYIRPGDLVFFKTGRQLLHVGIAMEDGNFVHASVSSGVMISNIEQDYWASRYLSTRRIL
ncbi:MAG: NlpC/P60 family protein [Balneolaceae bacterium]